MDFFSQIAARGHEQVVVFNNQELGLKAIVAIHDTTLGPALGGCRMRVYENSEQAFDDVLRLAEGMTYKSSLAGMDLGGGKACIVLDKKFTGDRTQLFSYFGECLNSLAGKYYTAEDMGTSPDDMRVIRSKTNFVVGFPISEGGSGDPSPWTALGVFNSIKALVEKVFKQTNLNGRSVAVQGVGHVGLPLVEYLCQAGAEVVVSDVNQDNIEAVQKKLPVRVVSPDNIYSADCEIFAPCAIGQTINKQTLPHFKFKAICGAANNQLQDSSLYQDLAGRNILYCPDFVVNSGGVISVGAELRHGGWNEEWVKQKVAAIADTTKQILSLSEQSGKFTEQVALELARQRIADKKAKK